MDELELLVDLYKGIARQGPGGEAETEQAIALAGIDRRAPLKIADIGCGTGASSLTLARALNARITAVDLLQPFLDVLEADARRAGLADRITPLCAGMERLPFADGEFDAIWSEGAIYHIGFERGVSEWRRYLKPGGLLAVTEITWLTDIRPAELQTHWSAEYPEIDTASAKLGALERNGYTPIGYFPLPARCWLENYYTPLADAFAGFLARHGDDGKARAIVEEVRREIALYSKYRAYYSYGMYIARKCVA